MGNKNSSERRRGSKYSHSMKSPKDVLQNEEKHRRQLVKSASCGTMMLMSQENQQVLRQGQPSDSSFIIQYPSNQSKLSSPNLLNGQPKPSTHHYNIHKPEHLLGFKSIFVNNRSDCESDPDVTQEKIVPIGKRSQSALDFLASKSPLQGIIKGRLAKGSCDQLDASVVSDNQQEESSPTQTGDKNSLRPPPKAEGTTSKKMECNLDKFAKLLAQVTGQKQGQISSEIFKKHVIPDSEIVAKYIWQLFTNYKDCNTTSESFFVQTAEKIYTLITDKDQISFYLKVFGSGKDSVDRDAFVDFLIGCYQLFAASNGEKVESVNQNEDYAGKEWMESVTKSCYHLKDEMSVCFISNWLLTNLPRLLLQLHKYILHQITTGYTQLTSGNKTTSLLGMNALLEGNLNNPKDESECNNTDSVDQDVILSPVLLWLLRSSLPSKFVSIFDKKVDPHPANSRALSPSQLIQHLMNSRTPPEKWSLLYNSDNDGISINRFQFHVFNYRGPTVLFIKADNGYTLAIASDCEWKESCHFWGGEDAMLIQLQPEFRIVERGTKILYSNFSIRGYSFGIQCGKDPRNVSLDIKPDFSYAHFKKIPCGIQKLFAYGCAPTEAKASQTEYKKWEAKQCENSRKVNIKAAEWKENPDKYLLELAGAYRSYDN